MAGSLTVIGTGYKIGGHVTVESLSHIRIAEKILANVDPVTHEWLLQTNPATESLADCYAVGKNRSRTYREMTERILASVRAGHRVCAVFYGHPAVACDAAHQSIRKARKEGFAACMLPGISAEDCLLADLGIDPAGGFQHLEATRFLVFRSRLDLTRPAILWQIGAVGADDSQLTPGIWNREAFDLVVEKLIRIYSPRHRVFVYEASKFPVCDPVIRKVALSKLGGAPVTISSTIYIPPLRRTEIDRKMLTRLNSVTRRGGSDIS
jgi:tetrapyrrole (corrin/porphyrin) methylase-like protein